MFDAILLRLRRPQPRLAVEEVPLLDALELEFCHGGHLMKFYLLRLELFTTTTIDALLRHYESILLSLLLFGRGNGASEEDGHISWFM